jgi:hypothetical protein
MQNHYLCTTELPQRPRLTRILPAVQCHNTIIRCGSSTGTHFDEHPGPVQCCLYSGPPVVLCKFNIDCSNGVWLDEDILSSLGWYKIWIILLWTPPHQGRHSRVQAATQLLHLQVHSLLQNFILIPSSPLSVVFLFHPSLFVHLTVFPSALPSPLSCICLHYFALAHPINIALPLLSPTSPAHHNITTLQLMTSSCLTGHSTCGIIAILPLLKYEMVYALNFGV